MNKEEFKSLQLQQKESGVGLLQFLKMQSVKYSTYRYWCRKYDEADSEQQPLAPISLKSAIPSPINKSTSRPEGITLALPNGIQAHFSSGMSEMAIQFLTQSLQNHVLPE